MRVRGSGDVSADTQTGDASDVTASLLNVVAAMAAATPVADKIRSLYGQLVKSGSAAALRRYPYRR